MSGPEVVVVGSLNCDLTQTNGLSGTVTGTHTYNDDGPFTVTVTVSDGIGSESGVTTVDVANVPPVVLEPINDTITEGDTYTFAGAFTDPGADAGITGATRGSRVRQCWPDRTRSSPNLFPWK